MKKKIKYKFHGDSGKKRTSLYNVWANMLQRCTNEKFNQYVDYGGRGITVCKKWTNSYPKFKKWALKNGYDEALTLDREDNDKGYKPSNCRWVTRTVQNQNSRMRKDNKSGYRGVMWRKQRKKWVAFIEFDGKTKQLGSFDNKDEAGRCYDRFVMDNNMEQPLNFDDYKSVCIDADHIVFLVANSKIHTTGFEDESNDESDEDCNWGVEADDEIDLEPYIKQFKEIVDNYVLIAEVESICYNWKIGKTRVIVSDHKNFRYDVYDEYKAKRSEKTGVLKALKEWSMTEYEFEVNCEADDVCAYYVRKGGIGFTTDKDLFAGVKGIWYNSHFMHKSWIRTSKSEADYFFKQQVLAGDSVDEIPALSGVGMKTAQKLLAKFGDSWDNILEIYESKGYDKDYLVQMTRLVCMSQWTPKKGLTLWEFPDEVC